MTSTRQHIALLICSVTDNSLKCISLSKGKTIMTFQLQGTAKCKPDWFIACGTSHPNIFLVTSDCCFNGVHLCAHRKGSTSGAHVVNSRCHHSSRFTSRTLPAPTSPPANPDLGLTPSLPQAALREMHNTKGWGCPCCLPPVLLMAGELGPCPANPMERSPAASPSPEGATLPRSAQAATNSREQEIGWPQIPI